MAGSSGLPVLDFRSTVPTHSESGEDLRVIEELRRVVERLGELRCRLGAALPLPVAEKVTEEVLRGVRAEGVQGGHLRIEIRGFRPQFQPGGPPGQAREAVGDQPVPQGQRGPDIILVVGGDAVELARVVVGHKSLVLHDGGRALIDVVSPSVAGEPLEVLETVRLGAGLHGVAHDRQEIDEESGLDKVGQRHLAHAVVGGEPLERRSLRVVVVVDVHVRVRSVRRSCRYRCSRWPILLVVAMSPQRPVSPVRPWLRAMRPKRKKRPTSARQGVTLEVEEHIARVSLGHVLETAAPLPRPRAE